MTIQKTIFSGLAGLSLVALGACTSDNTIVEAKDSAEKKAKVEQTQTDYVKPGAAIEFSHTYDGKTAPGEVETFQVFVKGGKLQGNVDLKMQNNDGLNIYNNVSPVQNLSVADDAPDGLDHTMEFSVGSQVPGRYYLKFLASSEQGDGTAIQRSYAIAIQVGDQPYKPELGKGMTMEETPTGEKIITMEAQETIEN